MTVVAVLAAPVCSPAGDTAPAPEPRGASTAPSAPRNPVITTDFADPHVVRDGATWYAYGVAGETNIQVARSTDLATWELLDDALPDRASWQSLAMGLTWAPEVMRLGEGWLMYYVAREEASGLQCISVAVSSSPRGPFTDGSERPMVCQPDGGGSIDPHPFLDADGRRYLFWKNDGNSRGKDTRIWVQQLRPDGRGVLGAPRDTGLMQTKPWQGSLVEAPAVLRSGGTYLLFYSANDYGSASYAMGYATATTVTGPYVDRSDSPWVASRGRAAGPGGQSVVELPDGSLLLAYHAWDVDRIGYPSGGVRGMWLDPLTVEDGVPVLHRP